LYHSFQVLFADPLPLHNDLNEFEFAYQNYVAWEADGGKELLLGANRLTTKQLFWLALARSRYRKQKADSGDDKDRTFFFFKDRYEPLETYKGFREAYHCDEVKV